MSDPNDIFGSCLFGCIFILGVVYACIKCPIIVAAAVVAVILAGLSK